MALVVKDRVKETTTTTGTGSISLGGAVTKFKTFSSALSNGDTTYYAIEQQGNTDEFEVGIGTYTSSGNTLARTTILSSSNSNNAVDFSAGTKNIFITYPADKAVYEDASGNVSGVGTLNATNVVASNLMQASAITLTGSIGVSVTENIIFEGTTADNYETFFTATDPTADRTITLPDATGTVALTSDINATNVTSAGALMDSEVTNLAQVKAFSSSDYATAAQGSTADAAMPKAGGTFSGDVIYGDDVKAKFGADSDLQIYFDSSTNKSHITESGSSHLVIQGQEIQFDNASGTSLLNMSASQVEILHGGSKKLETESTGIAVTGNITVSGTVDGRDLATDGTKLDGIEASATADQTAAEIRTLVESASDSNVFTDADHTKLNGIEASADVTDAANVTAAGALMDSEVTNLAQVKAFDSSDYATAAQGSTADAAMPKSGGTFTGDVIFSDNEYAKFGDAQDLEIGHDGSNGLINNYTNNLYITNYVDNKDVIIQSDNASGGTTVYFKADGSVGSTNLYFYGNEKLATTANGIKVTGNTQTDYLYVGEDDTGNAGLINVYGGATSEGGEIRIYPSAAEDTTINFWSIDVAADDLRMFSSTSDLAIVAVADGAVELYHNGSKKFDTTSSGIDVTGNITVSGTVDGRDVAADGSKLDGIQAGATAGGISADEAEVLAIALG